MTGLVIAVLSIVAAAYLILKKYYAPGATFCRLNYISRRGLYFA